MKDKLANFILILFMIVLLGNLIKVDGGMIWTGNYWIDCILVGAVSVAGFGFVLFMMGKIGEHHV